MFYMKWTVSWKRILSKNYSVHTSHRRSAHCNLYQVCCGGGYRGQLGRSHVRLWQWCDGRCGWYGPVPPNVLPIGESNVLISYEAHSLHSLCPCLNMYAVDSIYWHGLRRRYAKQISYETFTNILGLELRIATSLPCQHVQKTGLG